MNHKPNRILILSPAVYENMHSGTGMRAHIQAKLLSKNHDVTVVSENGTFQVKNGLFNRIDDFIVSYSGRVTSLAWSLLTGKHYLYCLWNIAKWRLPRFDQYDAVIVHYTALLEIFQDPANQHPCVLLDTHNNEREYYTTIAKASSNSLKKGLIMIQAYKSDRILKSASNAIQATVSVSESDRDWARDLCGEDVDHILVPNNLFPPSTLTWTGELSLVYVGSLHTEMNVQALKWFVADVWPSIQQRHPQVRLVLAGRNPRESIRTLAHRMNIEIMDSPTDVRDAYKRALALVVPALSGSGGKIKICEALSFGVPVLTTSTGLVGQSAEIRDRCIVADSISEWVDGVDLLVNTYRTRPTEWITKTREVISETYIGNTIRRIVECIENEPIKDGIVSSEQDKKMRAAL